MWRTDGRTDGQTDRITTPKTALSIARAVKITFCDFLARWGRSKLANSQLLTHIKRTMSYTICIYIGPICKALKIVKRILLTYLLTYAVVILFIRLSIVRSTRESFSRNDWIRYFHRYVAHHCSFLKTETVAKLRREDPHQYTGGIEKCAIFEKYFVAIAHLGIFLRAREQREQLSLRKLEACCFTEPVCNIHTYKYFADDQRINKVGSPVRLMNTAGM